MMSRLMARLTIVGVLMSGVGVNAAPGVAKSPSSTDASAKKLDVRVSGSASTAPATLRWTLFVGSHPDNRLLRVSIDGEAMFQSSDIPLEGADSARSHFVSWRDIPAGDYIVTAVLYGPSGPRATLVRRFAVIGR
jgi:hypothetical protein